MWCHTDLSLQHIHSRLVPGAPFCLLGYSFGGLLALELALELEADGREGHLYLVDSSPDFIKAWLEYSTGSNKEQFETNLICSMFNVIAPHESTTAAVRKVPRVISVKPY
jgi:fatty acid synthase